MGTPMQMYELFLGRSIPARGDVTDSEWRSFLDETVSANLPNGYTVQDAYGAWRNPATQHTAREATIVIRVALPDTSDSLAAVNRIRTAYQERFHQQLVGMSATPVCGSF
jgi:hypothetical protein